MNLVTIHNLDTLELYIFIMYLTTGMRVFLFKLLHIYLFRAM